jgi:DNA polymerase III subunit beta
MEFSIDKSTFLNALNFVRLALPTKSPMPILKTVFLIVEESRIELRATDTITYISCKMSVEAKSIGTCCIDSLITDILPKFSDGEIKFKSNGEKMTISQSKRKHNFAIVNPENFPPKPEVENYNSLDAARIKDALSKSKFATQNVPEDAKVLEGFNFAFETTEDGEVKQYIIGGNKKQVVKYEGIEFPGESVVIKSDPLMRVLAYVKDLDTLEMSFNPKLSAIRGSFNTVDFEVMFSREAEDYPEGANRVVNSFLSYTPYFRVVFNKSEFQNMLDICGTFQGSNRNYYVILSKNGGDGIKFSLNMPDVAEIEEIIEPLECEGGELEVPFHPVYLRDAVSQIESDKVELRFFSTESKQNPAQNSLMLKDPNNPNFTYMQAPVTMMR